MAKKPDRLKKSPQSPVSLRWWHVILIIVSIAALFMLLEGVKARYQKPAALTSPSDEPVAPKGQGEYLQKSYTTVRPPVPKKSGGPKAGHTSGTLAVIIDDMGSSMSEVRSLLSVNIPMTFAVIPGLAKSRAVAEAAHAAGRQVMVHLPMEPQGYPAQRLEENGLLIAHTEEEIVSRTVALLAAIPHAKGANNHMGSRFTENDRKMTAVMTVLRDQGLFFVDSRTTPRSKGLAIAEGVGVKSSGRNVFLDNEQDTTAIKKQLFAAAELSKKKGGVIAICHPHPATIAALRETMPELQRNGINFVHAGDLVR